MTSLEIKRLDKQTDREIPIFIMNNSNSEGNSKTETLKRQTDGGTPNGGGTLVRTNNNVNSMKSDNDDDCNSEEEDDEVSDASPIKVTKRLANDSADQQIATQLQFNKYGFLQPSLNSSIDASLQRLSSTSTNIKSTEYLNTSSSNSLAGGQNDGDSPNGAYNNTNYKERMQSMPIEYFTEQIPIDVIRKREIKWVDMLNNYDEWMNKKFLKLKSRCRKGIPQSIRSRAWMYLTGANLLKIQMENTTNDNYYLKCLQKKTVDNKCLDEIKRDLHRQFPLHEIFRNEIGINGLYNVLRAYAAHNPEVGYCQSQGPIAAVLMMHMPEEDAFYMLIRISDLYLKDYYKPDLERIQVDGLTLFYLFKKINPDAYKLMKKQQIHPTMYMTEWFMCVFARTLPWCTVLRVWDIFFCEGVKILYRIGLYLLKCIFSSKKKLSSILTMSQYDQQYALLSQLKDIELDYLKENILIKECFRISIDEKELNGAYLKAKCEFDKQQKQVKENREQYKKNKEK